MRFLSAFYPYRQEGLLLLRIGIGLAFVLHGYPKLVGGTDTWEKLGGAMGTVGLDFAPVFWGFVAALTEVLGGILLALGFLFRPVCVLLLLTMIVALVMHLGAGDPYSQYSNSLKSGILFLSLLFIGPGTYSLDAHFFGSPRYASTTGSLRE